MTTPSKTDKTSAKQLFINLGVGPLFNAICWFVGAALVVQFGEAKSTYIIAVCLFIAPVLMAIKFGVKNAVFAALATLIYTFSYIYIYSNEQIEPTDTWYSYTIVGIAVCAVWALLAFAISKAPEPSNRKCSTCNGTGKLIQSPKWLNTDYTGTCYTCLGKKIITNIHPHYQAVLIVDKYQTNIVETKQEYARLKDTYEQMGRQKLQGPEALGKELYQQTIELETKYYEQALLRLNQIKFLEKGLGKLHRMMYNSMIAENMLLKQKELTEMFDDNANDLGSVMSLKTQLEMHTDVIDRINALSVEIDLNNSTSIANSMAEEIEKMQAEL